MTGSKLLSPMPLAAKLLAASGAAMVVLACAVVGLVSIQFEASARINLATMPRYSEMFPDESPKLRVLELTDTSHGYPVAVSLVEPVRADAPTPPGVPRWPNAGEFFVSSALIDEVSSLSDRWGRAAGVIDQAAVPSAQSRMLIARPAVPLPDFAEASGFGVPPHLRDLTDAGMEAAGSGLPRDVAIGGVALALVLPAILFMSTAVRFATRQQRMRLRTLEILGCTPGRLRRTMLRAIGGPLAWGAAVAGGVACATLAVDLPLPLVEFTVRAADVRRCAPMLGVGIAWGILVVGLVAWFAARPPRLTARGGAVLPPRPAQKWVAALGVIGIVWCADQALRATNNALASGGTDDGFVFRALCFLIAALTIPAMASVVLRGLGRALAGLGRRTDVAGPILVGRSLASSPAGQRVVAAMALLVVLVGSAACWTIAGAIPAIEMQRAIDAIDGRFATLRGSAGSGALDADSRAALPDGTELLTVDTRMDANEQVTLSLNGSKASLDHWDLTPGTTTVGQLPHFLGSEMPAGAAQQITVEAGPDADVPTTGPEESFSRHYLAFRPDGGRVDRASVERAVTRADGIGWRTELGGESFIVGARDQAHELRWVAWFAAAGGLLLLGTVWLRTLGDQQTQARRLVPIDELFARRRCGGRVLAFRLTILSAMGLAAGSWVAWILARSLDSVVSVTGTIDAIVVATAGAAVLVCVAIGIPLTLTVVRRVRTWRPGATNA